MPPLSTTGPGSTSRRVPVSHAKRRRDPTRPHNQFPSTRPGSVAAGFASQGAHRTTPCQATYLPLGARPTNGRDRASSRVERKPRSLLVHRHLVGVEGPNFELDVVGVAKHDEWSAVLLVDAGVRDSECVEVICPSFERLTSGTRNVTGFLGCGASYVGLVAWTT